MQYICHLLSSHVVRSFGKHYYMSLIVFSLLQFSGWSSDPAWPPHNSWLPCSNWMWYFHVVLETIFLRPLSMSAPTELHSPHSPSDLDTVFFLPSSLTAEYTATRILGQIDYFMSYFVRTVCPCALTPPPPYYLFITPLTSSLISPFTSPISLLLARQLCAH